VVVTSRGRWARPLLVGTAIALGLVVVFHLAGGWYFSNVLYDSALDAEARRAELERDFTVEVLALGDGAITLEAGEGGDQRRPGVWGIAWPDGYGIAGDIRDEGPDRVTRAFSLMTGTAPAPGDLVDVDAKAFPDAPVDALGVAPEVVQVPGPLGDHESWFFGGTRPTWVLLLHGNTPNRLDMAKLLPRLREEGYPALLVSLRNDPGAPPDPSGMFRYGETEWADLEAAVRHAVDRGADDVVLVGPSMGGGTPILVFHGSEDGDIPLATSRDLAAARPDLVTLQEVPRAGHLGTWNVDPVAYEERFVDFLEEHAD
jgi:pimeloyl-ACP methyl ester carboxylesterase